MGRFLKLAVVTAIGVAALGSAIDASAVEPIDPPIDTQDYRMFPICRPGPTCLRVGTVIINDQFLDNQTVQLGFPLWLLIPSVVTTDQPPNELAAPVDPTHRYCFSTSPGPDRPNVVQISTIFGTFITSVGPSKHLCIPTDKIEIN